MPGKKIFCLMLAALVLISAGACGADTDTANGTVTITVTDNGWDSQKLHNAIAEYIVLNGYEGYEWQLSSASSTMNWQSLIRGDIDLDIESWTGNVATYPEDVKNGDIIDVGILVPDSAQGFYVPRYVIEGDTERGIKAVAPDLKTVRDLTKYASVFPDDEDPGRGRIYGAVPGWMVDEILYKKYEAYGLDETYNYVRLGSESSIFASLASAYNLGIPWVGYCYEPTWISGKLDIVLLEDAPYDPELYLEGKCEVEKQALKIVSSKYFAEKAPDLLEFFKKYQTGSAFISEGLAYLSENSGQSYQEAAVWMLKQHEDVLDQWLPAENAEKVRAALAAEE
ncbi:MAG TPA: glycine betaine ABC transporter substrate-binding protein [Anaerovoracaceae bacterium]|nr:glycine betaine ABC transporter substrate-binding protein [Anaerovoracaceae bacterium]